jgi:hypothetical protein
VNARGAGLAGGDRLPALDGLRIPGRRHGDGHREDRTEPVNDVEAEEQGDTETVAIDGQPLQPIDLRWIRHEQQRSRRAARSAASTRPGWSSPARCRG